MKRNYFFVVAIIMALAVVGIASGASSDQGRRLAGPFCVAKQNAGRLAGTVRSIALTRACRSYEIRKVGLAVPDNDPVVAGPQGPKGDTGAAGANGKDGTNGLDGKDGASLTVTDITREENTTTVTLSDGSSFTLYDGQNGQNGSDGKDGADSTVPGPAGPAGKDGTNGTNGKDGKDGTVTGTVPVCASNGGNLKLCGGDNGHDPVGYLVLTGTSD